MKIECIRIRPGGTKVQLGAEEYHFKPQADGRHVAEVTNTGHVSTLLRIPAYQIAEGDEPAKTAAVTTKPVTSTDAAAKATKAAKAVETKAASDAAVEAAAKAAADEAALLAAKKPDDEPKGDADGDGSTPPAEGEGDDYDAMDRAALAELYEKRLGRLPHPRAGEDTLRAKLREKDAEEAALLAAGQEG